MDGRDKNFVHESEDSYYYVCFKEWKLIVAQTWSQANNKKRSWKKIISLDAVRNVTWQANVKI